MRGFLAIFRTASLAEGGEASRVLARAGKWIAGFDPAAIRTVEEGPFRCTLYSESSRPFGYNQVLRETAGAISLHAGPRLLWRDPDSLPEVRASDPESLAAREDLFSGGMETNVLLAYVRAERSLVVKTDLLNSLFVYAARSDGLLLFSSSSWLLARLLRSRLHPVSMAEFLTEGILYGQRSLYDGVRLLRPSRFHRFDAEGREESREYWEVDKLPLESIRMLDAKEAILRQLDREFQEMGCGGRTLVLDLTGGYDSRCNVGMALRNKVRFRTTVSGTAESDDAKVAAAIAARYGFPHERIAPPAGRLEDWGEAIDAAFACTDGEYDLLEYAHIWNVHRNHAAEDEVSVQGATADLTRHYYFYPIDHHGDLPLARMIEKKFTPLIDTRTFLHPSIAMDWTGHMIARMAEVDYPGLPAQARVNNIYLRLRMQFWQGRIQSSTNRIHAAFTPWTSLPVLRAILTTRWDEMKHRRLTRHLVRDIYPGLDRIPMAGGTRAGVGLGAALRAIPGGTAFLAKKVLQRLDRLRRAPPRPPRLLGLRESVCARAEMLADVLHPEVVGSLARRGAEFPLAESAWSKLYSLLEVKSRVAGL